MSKTRWVIVAQLTIEAHAPTVYGTWETKEAASEQLERWERRIERTFGYDPGTGITMSVEPMYGKAAAFFERDFEQAHGRQLSGTGQGSGVFDE